MPPSRPRAIWHSSTTGRAETTRTASNPQYFGCCDATRANGFNGNDTWRHRLGTRSFESIQITFNRNTTVGTPYFETLGQNVASELGILGTSQAPTNYGPPTLS